MTAAEIDSYLADPAEPARGTLEALRTTILAIIPDAEQGISYAIPAFRANGRVVARFAVFTHHLTYVPHSESVLGPLADDLAGLLAVQERPAVRRRHPAAPGHRGETHRGADEPDRSREWNPARLR